MTAFVVCAAVLCLVAAIVLARPLWWRRHAAAGGSEVESLAEQMRQLTALHAAGTLSAEQFTQSRALVERKTLEALQGAKAAVPTAVQAPSAGLVGALLVFVFAVTGGGYWLLGSPRDLELGPGSTPAQSAGAGADAASAPHEVSAEQIAAMVDRLAERLKSKPDDGEGWLMLARSYVAIGKHAQAVDAFAQAARLRPNDADLLADYADALAMKNNRSLTGEPTTLVERALQIDAKNPKALALAGTAAFDRQDYAGAVRYWEQVTQVEPADGPYATQLRGAIDEARQRAGMPAVAASASAPKGQAPSTALAGDTAARIDGTVRLAPTLQARVSPDDTVFIYARAVEGPRMPLAILRKRAGELPLTFTLDDSMAMSPDAKLSGAGRVLVGARISKSGNALPQPGDLQGTASSVAVGSTGVQLVIDQEVTK
jgi:cytochrome c-type biogenesis protein CcmH